MTGFDDCKGLQAQRPNESKGESVSGESSYKHLLQIYKTLILIYV